MTVMMALQRRAGLAVAVVVIAVCLAACGKPAEAPVAGPVGCGAHALAAALGELGSDVDVDALSRMAATDERGWTSMYDLKLAAEALGFKATGYEMNIAELLAAEEPMVAHIRDSHFVTIVRREGDTLGIVDNGRPREMSVAAFEEQWHGAVLVIEGRGDGG